MTGTPASSAQAAFSPKPKKRRGPSEEEKKIRALEKELRRKDKALAEAAALLVLEKKLQAFYGVAEGDDTDEKRDDES